MSGGFADQVVTAESGGNATARNPRSSATGAGQFIDSTWLDMVGRYRPDLAGLPRDQVLGLRNDPDLSREMVGRYAEENGAKLRAAGLPDNDGTRYLSHFAGPAGARAVLSADPGTPVAQVLTPGQVAANPFVQPMTAGQLVDWAHGKMGGGRTMRMPGALSGPAGFGLAGPTQSMGPGTTLPAGGTTMRLPDDDGADVAALLRTLTAPDTPAPSPVAQAAAGLAQQPMRQQPARSTGAATPFGFGSAHQPARPRPMAFDPGAFLRLLTPRDRR